MWRKIMKKIIYITCGLWPFISLYGDTPKWSELRCIWSCSFNACANVKILRKCNENCDPKYLEKCMRVAKEAFGEKLLPEVLKPIALTAPAVAKQENPKDAPVKATTKEPVKAASKAKELPKDDEAKTDDTQAAETPLDTSDTDEPKEE
jgi:hypothetical protein